MQPQMDSSNSATSIHRGDVPCMDGERLTMIKGLRPAQGAPATQCFSPPSYLTGGPTVRQRCLAGLWFGATAALIPFVFAVLCGGFGGSTKGGREACWMMLMLVAIAGLCGAWVGGRILNSAIVRTGGEAFLTGANVTFRSMIGFAVAVATVATMSFPAGITAVDTWWGTFFIVAFYSVVFAGWILIPFGGLAGCALRWCSGWDGFGSHPRYQPLTPSSYPGPFADTRTLSFPAACLPVSAENARTLANCPGCRRIVSRAAASCPRCGHGI